MKIKDFVDSLKNNSESTMIWNLSSCQSIPEHYHITEVGRVQKDFFDCGGTKRSTKSCVLQIWVADDIHHRMKTDKLAKIIDSASSVLEENLEVEVEYQTGGALSYYLLESLLETPSSLVLQLTPKKTTCLAPDKCKVNVCSPNSGCCQ